ncbi:MAG: thiopurine S-methyltransferase [Gammaproteobacteria bacterium]
MKPADWLDRWKQNRIGFHEPGVNTYLRQYLPAFNLEPGDTIFLPLCGKAHDIAWLAQQGFQVVGVELSGIAIEAFFAEQGLHYLQSESGKFLLSKSGNISLYQGDYFDFPQKVLTECKLIYDRASLIAFDLGDRGRYCEYLRSITPPQTDMLLITLDYDQTQMDGPPFAVSRTEVEQLYRSHYQLEKLVSNDVLDERPRWRERGLTALTETVFRLRETKHQ